MTLLFAKSYKMMPFIWAASRSGSSLTTTPTVSPRRLHECVHSNNALWTGEQTCPREQDITGKGAILHSCESQHLKYPFHIAKAAFTPHSTPLSNNRLYCRYTPVRFGLLSHRAWNLRILASAVYKTERRAERRHHRLKSKLCFHLST